MTHPWLTEESPLSIRWTGTGTSAWSEVSDDGTTFRLVSTEGGAEAIDLGPLDLTEPANSKIKWLCMEIDALSDYACKVQTFENRQSNASMTTGLASGATDLSDGLDHAVAWDLRLPSEGGRQFGNELVDSMALIEEAIGLGPVAK